MAGFYLVLNTGSSSIKFAGFDSATLQQRFHGLIDYPGSGNQARFNATFNGKKSQKSVPLTVAEDTFSLPVQPIFEWINALSLPDPMMAIGHRVVHGGELFANPVIISSQVIAAIESCTKFAPLHNPSNLLGINQSREHYPDLPQVAIFDTAFHQTLPEHAYLYALPMNLYRDHGVRKYGFHGSSHEYVSRQAAIQLSKPINEFNCITLHLGNGCSAAAISQGKSLDTTMGLTPLEGMMMGTRSGNLDPGLLQFLCQALNSNIDAVTNLLNKKSGLLGVSELSSDMRTIEVEAAQGNASAQLAFAMFCFNAAKAVATMRVSLPKLDALVFTGGIGENSVSVRKAIVEQLRWLDITLDDALNRVHGEQTQGVITVGGLQAKNKAMVVATDEEKMIAKHMQALL